MKEKIKKIIESVHHVTIDDEDAILSDYGIDSLDSIDIIMQLEEAFNINISTSEITNEMSFKDILGIIEKKV